VGVRAITLAKKCSDSLLLYFNVFRDPEIRDLPRPAYRQAGSHIGAIMERMGAVALKRRFF
jgi:hypothetical protein